MAETVKQDGVVQTLCRMCDDHCGINVYVKEGRIINIDGMEHHPWNKGRICPKGRAALDFVYAPDRLMKPLKRQGNNWVEISMEQALAEIAQKMREIQKAYGAQSIGVWKGEGVGFNQQEGYARRFAYAIGTPNYFSNNTQCSVARKIGYFLVRGHKPVPDLEKAKCIIIWGVNPPYSQPHLTRMILDARERGARLIVIDPRQSAMARRADLYVPIKPATDGALALGMINLIIQNKWYDEDFIENHTVGFKKLADYAAKFTEDYVARETGIDEKTLLAIAKTFVRNAPRAAIFTGNGLDHCQNCVNNIRAIASIGVLCGCVDHVGGELISEDLNLNSLVPNWKDLKYKEPIGSKEYPVLYDFGENHTLLAMDAILTNKPYPLKGLILTAANPALTNANSAKVVKALSSLDLFVVRDLFLTETAKLAHYVLPAASFFERSELFVNKHFQRIYQTTKIIENKECVDEYTFWHELACKLEIEDYFPWQNEEEVNAWLLEPTGITGKELKTKPEGYEYKPIKYLKYQNQPRPFNTPSGKMEFTSNYLKELGYNELPEYHAPSYLTEENEKFPFVLTSGARNILYNNSRYRNIPRFVQAVPFPEIEINALDAA